MPLRYRSKRPAYKKKMMPKRRLYGRRGAAGRIRTIMPSAPSFTETFALARDNFFLPAGTGIGKVFKVSFFNIPQRSQYMNLYTQYRINWVKVMVLPQYNTSAAEVNTAFASATGRVGQGRITYAIQDSPNVPIPLSEQDVLLDNGAKVKPLGTKWTCSFKPVPDVAQTTSAGTIATKQKYRQWFNYDDVLTANNPEHGGVAAWFNLAGAAGTSTEGISYEVFYKVNFSLRDPR